MKIFVYGSLLNELKLKELNINIINKTKAVLNNYELRFKSLDNICSFLTINKKEGANVLGLILDIVDENIKKLDRYEEVDNNLYYKDYILINDINVLTYIMNENAQDLLPHASYFNDIYDSYINLGFDINNLFKAFSYINYKMKDLMSNCYHYLASGLDYQEHLNTRNLLDLINNTCHADFKEREELGRKLFNKVGSNLIFNKPFHCDHGFNISIGDNFYANYNLTILDTSKVNIGNNVFFGPNVSLVCPTHPMVAEYRNTLFEASRDITINDNVWLASNVVICGGVTIGKNVVVGAGSVVTKSIEDNVFVAGNPARVIRKINEKDYYNGNRDLLIAKTLIERMK